MTDSSVKQGDGAEASSTTLLQRVRLRDEHAWSRLVDLCDPLVYGWCRKSGLQAADARDVGQEVFKSVFQGIGTYQREPGKGSFRGWLRRIVQRKIIEHHRRLKHLPAENQALEVLASTESSSETSPENLILYQRALELIRSEFEEATWKSFWRQAVDGVRAAQVAEELGISDNAAYLAKSRVLKRLRDEFGDFLECL